MTFLPIVARELRVAARRRATYWLRFGLALAVLVLWFFLLVLGRSSVPVVQRGQMLFLAIGVLAIGFCLLAGLFLTADCLSEEKREGTLGLLFLTELKSYDVVLGKLTATSLHAVFGLLAILPLLALPLLMGGVTAGEFWRITVALLATLVWSLSVGILVSAISRETRVAMTGTVLVLTVLAGLLPALWWLHKLVAKRAGWDFLLWPSPVYLYSRSFDVWFRLRQGPQEFWRSLLTLGLLGASFLTLASLHLPRAWRDKGDVSVGYKQAGWRRRWRFGSDQVRSRRRRWLERNPFYWLARRDRLPGLLAWGLPAIVLPIWVCFLPGIHSKTQRIVEPCLSVTIFTAFGLHQLLKGLIAAEASRRLSDDRRSGALELLLVTPLPVEQIVVGQGRVLTAIFLGPMALAALANVALLSVMLSSDALDTEPEVRAVYGEIFLGGVVMLLVDFYALRWVGMWMALRARRHPRAIFGTLARVMFLPWLAILCFVLLGSSGAGFSTGDVAGLTTVWLLLGLTVDLAFAGRAKSQLLRSLRERTI